MSRIFHITSFVCAIGAAICCSCQQNTAPRGVSVGVRNYSDAVVHINQVDPAYRAYFRDQDAANYSLSDQRKAYMAAAEVARTPVRESDYRPGATRKKSVVTKNARAAKGKKTAIVARKGAKPAAKGKAIVRAKSNAAAKRSVAVRKPYRKR